MVIIIRYIISITYRHRYIFYITTYERENQIASAKQYHVQFHDERNIYS